MVTTKTNGEIFDLLSDESIIKKLKYPDQDILNLMFLHHAKILPRKYNCIYTIKSEFEEKIVNITPSLLMMKLSSYIILV